MKGKIVKVIITYVIYSILPVFDLSYRPKAGYFNTFLWFSQFFQAKSMKRPRLLTSIRFLNHNATSFNTTNIIYLI
jgi:hypothetical protein